MDEKEKEEAQGQLITSLIGVAGAILVLYLILS